MEPWKKKIELNQQNSSKKDISSEFSQLLNMLKTLNLPKEENESPSQNIDDQATEQEELAPNLKTSQEDNSTNDSTLEKKHEQLLNKIYDFFKITEAKRKKYKNTLDKIDEVKEENNLKLPESIIRTLIVRFLNTRFISNNSDLNNRSNSFEKGDGFYKWDTKNVAIHLKTNQLNQLLRDKYGYNYDAGEKESIALSFYFDLSGSMSNYTYYLAVIAIELLKRKVKVLIGYNEKIFCQIDSLNDNTSIEDFNDMLKNMSSYAQNKSNSLRKIKLKMIDENIDDYLTKKDAEKCVIFSDFDSLEEIKRLSNFCQVYYFSFESEPDMWDLEGFNGFYHQTYSIDDIVEGLIKISDYNFETIKYVRNKQKVKKQW